MDGIKQNLTNLFKSAKVLEFARMDLLDNGRYLMEELIKDPQLNASVHYREIY